MERESNLLSLFFCPGFWPSAPHLQSAVYDSNNDSKKRKTPTADSCGGLGFGFYDLIEPMIVPAIIIIDDIRANRLDTILSPIKTSRLMFMARVKTPTTTKRMPKIFQWLMIYPL